MHAARGRDEEGATAPHEALALGQQDVPSLAAAACRELGYVDMLRGSYERARDWMDRATGLAPDDPVEQARIATVRGETDSNFGAVFALWATLFGTFRTQTALPQETMPLGHSEIRDRRACSPAWLLASALLTLASAPAAVPGRL